MADGSNRCSGSHIAERLVVALLDAAEFETLLKTSEGETLDFKTTLNLTEDEGRLKFVKDVLCLYNTPRDVTAHIVVGVRKHADGTYDLVGVPGHPDSAFLMDQLKDRVHPVPTFQYLVVAYREMEYGVVAIPPSQDGPSVPLRDYGAGLLRQWTVYFRRGSVNSVATPDDSRRILDWFQRRPEAPQPDWSDSAWDRFYRATALFDPARRYILLVSPCMGDSATDLSAIGEVGWTAVFDFNPESDSDGVLAAARPRLEMHRSLHLATLEDAPALNIDAATYWFFPRGIAGRQVTLDTGRWIDWWRRSGSLLERQVHRLAAAVAPAPTTIVVLWYTEGLNRYLQSALDVCLGSFGQTADVVVATDSPTDLSRETSESGTPVIEIPLHHLCSGLAAVRRRVGETPGGAATQLPSRSGAPVHLSTEDQLWVEEELEIVHLGLGSSSEEGRAVGREFLRGAPVSWFDLALHYDVDRELTERLERQIERELSRRRTSRINLYHSPGAGGTTTARRVLWDFHAQVPCAILKRTTPQETAERLYRITALTELPMVLLVDGADIVQSEIDQLFTCLGSRQIPVAVLQVLRRFAPQTEGERVFVLEEALTDLEAERFAHVYGREQPHRQRQLEALAKADGDPRFRSAFYFGLHTFGEEFLGLEPYLRRRLESLTPVQTKVVGFLALAHHYAQRSLPAQVFCGLLGLPATRVVNLTSALPGPALDLLVEAARGQWRTTHDLIATEVLRRLLAPGAGDPRLWKQNLSTWAVEFADLCRGSGPLPAVDLLDVARRAFIYRDNAELLGTERSANALFSQLLQDVPSREGALEILRGLCDRFPSEPHFWAHLGRFYSLERKEYGQALGCIDMALELDDKDPVLHHMRGMAQRQIAYDRMDAGSPLADVVEMAKASSASFAQARELSPEDEHGYISEVQMLAKVLDYAGRRHEAGVLGYLASRAADPYLRDCLERAEDLLERVRRNREGQSDSPYEANCRARLDSLYGRHDQALQTLGNLLLRRDVYAPPVRRQIVWTLLARRGRSFAALRRDEADRAVTLLEDNLREEPNADTNLRLWVQAVRRSSRPPSLEAMIEKVGYWRANSGSLEASFYLYVLYVLQALEGSTLAIDAAVRHLEECRQKARFRRFRTQSLEWLGEGHGVARLVHQSELGTWGDQDFWENAARLARPAGRVVRITAPQAGEIEIAGNLRAFFVPAKGGYSQGRSENRLVRFYLGFSYDGPRAWGVTDA